MKILIIVMFILRVLRLILKAIDNLIDDMVPYNYKV